MQIKVFDIADEILIQTVAITKSVDAPDNMFLFHCYHCGTGISKIQGEIIRINAGAMPTDDTRVVQQCHRCKENYSFVQTRIRPTLTQLSLTNQPNEKVSTFHCIICRTPLAQYIGEKIVKLPEMTKLKLPTLIDCPHCLETYLLNEVVSVTM